MFLSVQVVNSLILKMQNIAIFATNILDILFETECVCKDSFTYKNFQITEIGNFQLDRKNNQFEYRI